MSTRCLVCVCFMSLYSFFFFFSSRRRHTRCSRDWSSDVCSSDLDASSWSDGFIHIGQKAGAKTIAFLAADQEFARNLANGARVLAKKAGLQTVYAQNSPPATVDFSAMIRAIRAARPDIVFVMSYPNDSVAIVRAINEIGVGDSVKLFGGGMVGLQFTPNMVSLGSSLNGIVNYNSYVPGVKYPGIEDFLQRYAKRALEAKVDPLGFYLPPFNYAIGQMLEQAINATKSLDHRKLADYLHKNEMQTIVGPIRSEEHTSELQSRLHLVCRLLLEKKKNTLTNQQCQVSSRSTSIHYNISDDTH